MLVNLEARPEDVMTNNNDRSWLRIARPFAWLGAAFFFVVAEGFVMSAEWNHHIYRIESLRFWFVPIMSIVPLLVASAFERSVRRESESRGYAETGIDASAMMGMLALAAYSSMVCALCIFM